MPVVRSTADPKKSAVVDPMEDASFWIGATIRCPQRDKKLRQRAQTVKKKLRQRAQTVKKKLRQRAQTVEAAAAAAAAAATTAL